MEYLTLIKAKYKSGDFAPEFFYAPGCMNIGSGGIVKDDGGLEYDVIAVTHCQCRNPKEAEMLASAIKGSKPAYLYDCVFKNEEDSDGKPD